MTKAIPVALAGLLLIGCSLAINGTKDGHLLKPDQRLTLLERAQVWTPTNVAAMNVMRGPAKDGFPPEADVTCSYREKRFNGKTPKFGCALNSKDVVKVRYGRDNGEVYAGVAATRLLWALGFGADPLYPVHVFCRGCPASEMPEGTRVPGGLRFDVAAIERTFPGRKIEREKDDDGWSWDELDKVSAAAGGAPLAHRDALKLLAVFIQHTDNKSNQQRLVCRSGGSKGDLADCAQPFMLIHDVGMTFGRANLFNRGTVGSVNLDMWSKTPIWSDAEHCIGNLPPSQTGTLANPTISEEGRAFLAKLLGRLSDRQIHDLFAVARFDRKPSGGGPIDAWVAAFKQKREEIAGTTCR